ncbi:uncharacterized protein C12orf40 homolog isoform X2 [Lethenteron reissneri]|uniref:uncharacterized protein C12orf40 homolog isoform X2 n=1 Tax=Lethenteron reissneri TaxID=7753 RepID=UPI002AB71A03|nr:uncharacterized protein C12orf40 homolog isoform X2 [Lethenteron reissneri]
MNWVSGLRSQIRFKENKELQKNFFQRHKCEEYPQPLKLPSPRKRQHRDVSMDLVSLHMVNHIACNDTKDNSRQVTKMTQEQSGSRIWHEHVELPSYPQAKMHAPSQLMFADGTSSSNSSQAKHGCSSNRRKAVLNRACFKPSVRARKMPPPPPPKNFQSGGGLYPINEHHLPAADPAVFSGGPSCSWPQPPKTHSMVTAAQSPFMPISSPWIVVESNTNADAICRRALCVEQRDLDTSNPTSSWAPRGVGPSAGHFMESSDFAHEAVALQVVPSLVHYQNSDHKPKTPRPFQLDTTEHSLFEDDGFFLGDRGPALFLHGLSTSGHTSPRPWFEVEDPWWQQQQQHQQQLGLNPMQWGLGGPPHEPPQEYGPADMELASGFILQHLSGLDSAFDGKMTPAVHSIRDLLCFQTNTVAVPVQQRGGSCERSAIWLQESAAWSFTNAHSVANDRWNSAPDQKINAHEQDHEEEEEESQPVGHSNRPRPPLQLRGAFPCREGDPLCHPKLLWTVPGCSTSSMESESSQVLSEMSDTDGDSETSATCSSPTLSASSGASTDRLSNQLVPTCTSDGPCVQRTARGPTEVIPRPRAQKKEQWVEEDEQRDGHKVEEDRHEKEHEDEEQEEREEEEDAGEVADPAAPVKGHASRHATVQRDLAPEMQPTEYWRLLQVSHQLQKLQQQGHQRKKLELQ